MFADLAYARPAGVMAFLARENVAHLLKASAPASYAYRYSGEAK